MSLGTVTLENGTLTADTPTTTGLIDGWGAYNEQDTPESFMEKFKDWSNGYVIAKEVS